MPPSRNTYRAITELHLTTATEELVVAPGDLTDQIEATDVQWMLDSGYVAEVGEGEEDEPYVMPAWVYRSLNRDDEYEALLAEQGEVEAEEEAPPEVESEEVEPEPEATPVEETPEAPVVEGEG